ncbi:hypothetical protein MPTK1_1g24960 [Marchantia polymorpha subsp. ruderalis]|uniref:Uncharacterized protein n=2 Tax=Marchantia polymorpha TaxID=3197 RepID=A0AAF6AU14_MARPO|nr:hypothetical protein MARPO_0061s0029 [Marchantia polymorpha]BBM99934.1 hypothetical protein Mp_1g24960 [Marchantia polymorpha subsp. ruderalis]|eukprot:PTQ36752.1 hypothetical protein MARPO_0061s0029 [Marchantia polymorpha]
MVRSKQASRTDEITNRSEPWAESTITPVTYFLARSSPPSPSPSPPLPSAPTPHLARSPMISFPSHWPRVKMVNRVTRPRIAIGRPLRAVVTGDGWSSLCTDRSDSVTPPPLGFRYFYASTDPFGFLVRDHLKWLQWCRM